ncbi:MAG: MATE family efflux transporter [Defluviicoccus sp.]|nr:MATE family efflux transporter [Defluviicoccus sp.]
MIAGSAEHHRAVWRLSVPIILSNISVPLLGAVDTAVVGHLPEPHHLGAVALGSMVFNFIYWGFGFLRMGTAGLTAQAHGAGNSDEVLAAVVRALTIAGAIAFVTLAAQTLIVAAVFDLVEASADVESSARTYVLTRIWGAPAALSIYVILGWFLGLQNTRATLYVQLWMNGLNIVLDVLFVVGFGWGVFGVALATVIAEFAGLALALWLMRRALRGIAGRLDWNRVRSRRRMRMTLGLNADIFIRTVCLVFAFAYFTAQGARLGDILLAANAVLMNFQLFMAHGLDGFAHAAQAMVGRAVGAADRAELRAAIRVSSFWAIVAAAGFVLVYAVAGEGIVALLTGIEEVREAAGDYLLWSVAMPALSVAAFQFDGIFLGATLGRQMRNMMILSVAVYLVLCAFLIPLWGNHGLWFAFAVFMALRGLTLGAVFPAVGRSIPS